MASVDGPAVVRAGGDNPGGRVASVDSPAVVRAAWLSGFGLSVTKAGAKSASLKTSGLYGQMPVEEKPA